jgi:hypothetical protein
MVHLPSARCRPESLDDEYEPMAYRRRSRGNGRGLLVALLSVAALAAVVVTVLAWRSGELKLPWPERGRTEPEPLPVAVMDTTAAPFDSLATAAGDSLSAFADSTAAPAAHCRHHAGRPRARRLRGPRARPA